MIVRRQTAERWGDSVVEKLASDIQKDFPGIEGFSPRNAWRMRAFYLASYGKTLTVLYDIRLARRGGARAGICAAGFVDSSFGPVNVCLPVHKKWA